MKGNRKLNFRKMGSGSGSVGNFPTSLEAAPNRSSEPAFVPREAHFPLSDKVKDFMCRGLIDEFHLAEIITLCAAHNLSPWLTTSQAWVEKYDPTQHQSHTKSDTAYHFFGYNVWWFTLHPENSRHGPAEP